MNLIEILATILGLISIYFAYREHIYCWPTGIVMVLLYMQVFYEEKLYPNMGLQVIFLGLQVYGWRNWCKENKEKEKLLIKKITLSLILKLKFILIICTLIIGYLLSSYTDSDLPYIATGATILSLEAQWLLAKKVLESWLIWGFVDLIFILIYVFKGLYPTTGLHVVFFILAVSGYFKWRNSTYNNCTSNIMFVFIKGI